MAPEDIVHADWKVLVAGAFACGVIAGGGVYAAMICESMTLVMADRSLHGRNRHPSGALGLVCCPTALLCGAS